MKDESTTQRAHRQAVWARHWASGAAHSCAGSYDQTYGGAIASFWQEVHALTAPGSRLLDIATGNGALPRLLLQMRPELDVQIDAVDIVPMVPAWVHALPAAQAGRLRFHTEVAAESLPFPAASADLIVSQYGLEYADLARAVPELTRVRAPHGRIALVMHHAASRPVTLAAVEMGHIEWLRSPQGLLATAAAMVEPMARAASEAGRAALAGDAVALAARARFNAAQEELVERARATDGADVLFEARQAVVELLNLARQQGHEAAGRAWAVLDITMADAHFRLAELRACALGEAEAQAIKHALEAQSLRCALRTLSEGPHLMGWALTAESPQE
jgi:ubiquinone/menaquinone biosynthesis C-methylase UbiE